MIHSLLQVTETNPNSTPGLAEYWRLAFAGGAPVCRELLRSFRDRFGVPIVDGYGLTERSAVAAFNPPDGIQKDASIGLPLWGVQLRIVDERTEDVPVGEQGELIMRGPNVMKGYYGNTAATEAVFRGGWLHTGDVGLADEDGYYYVGDRIKDLIIRGGQNICHRDVEEVLLTHPAVAQAAVIGRPDEHLGEEVAALVVAKAGHRVSEEELIQYTRERLPGFAYPRIVEWRDSLPVGPTGKILKRELRADASRK